MDIDYKEIRYNGKWHKIGDEIEIIENKKIIFFWNKMFKTKCNIISIHDDCTAILQNGNKTKTITGNVNVYLK